MRSLEALARLPTVGSRLDALDALITSAIEETRERRVWMVKSDFEYATIYAAVALHLREQLQADFMVGTWQQGDFAEASRRSLRVGATVQQDASGRYNDPLKTPESFYPRSMSHAPPS
jgi:hypothetical protein